VQQLEGATIVCATDVNDFVACKYSTTSGDFVRELLDEDGRE